MSITTICINTKIPKHLRDEINRITGSKVGKTRHWLLSDEVANVISNCNNPRDYLSYIHPNLYHVANSTWKDRLIRENLPECQLYDLETRQPRL